MKKFMMDTKTALGVAPKTEDKEYDEKSSNVKGIEKALSDYKSAMEKMRSAAQSFVSAMEAMDKVFDVLSKGEEATPAMRTTATDYQEIVKKVNEQILADFKKSIDEHEHMAPVKDLAAECKKLESKRNSSMAEYDTYRDAVHTKEVEYKKKNKDLSDSKHYQDEVHKRDNLKEEFDKADKEFKDKYAELEKVRIENYSNGMEGYLAGTSQFLSAIEKELSSVVGKAKS